MQTLNGRSMSAAAMISSSSTCPQSSKPLLEVSTVEARSCRAFVSLNTSRLMWNSTLLDDIAPPVFLDTD